MMKNFILTNDKGLRLGYTTGTCAAAAAAAATEALLSGEQIHTVNIRTPKGITLELDVETPQRTNLCVVCGVRKFSGDDPDITDGIYIMARVSKISIGTKIVGGTGVGTVTKEGISVAVGQPAINNVPRQMIIDEVEKISKKYKYKGGLRIEIEVPRGKELAAKTFNPRLGIVGGISIIGTTGIIEPMSNRAVIETTKLEIDVLEAQEEKRIILVPGNYGSNFAEKQFGINLNQAVQCSNFIGEALEYVACKSFRKVVFLGHAGKLVKIAGGIMNTHSSNADCRMEIITAHAALKGEISSKIAQELLECITVDAANEILKGLGLTKIVWNSVGKKIIYHISNKLGNNQELAVVVFGKDGILFQHGEL